MIVLYVLLLAISILCSSRAEAQEKKQIRVVFTSQTWTSSLPFRVALAKGYFRAQGLSVEPVFYSRRTGSHSSFDIRRCRFRQYWRRSGGDSYTARGLDISIIGSISNRVNYAIIGNSASKNVEDLRGKIIGVTGAGAFSGFRYQNFFKE